MLLTRFGRKRTWARSFATVVGKSEIAVLHNRLQAHLRRAIRHGSIRSESASLIIFPPVRAFFLDFVVQLPQPVA